MKIHPGPIPHAIKIDSDFTPAGKLAKISVPAEIPTAPFHLPKPH